MIKYKYLVFIILLISVLVIPINAAIMPQPRVELDKYEITVSSIDNIYIEGSVSLARGQWITLHTSTDSLPINFIITPDSNRAEDFKIKVPKMFLKEGTNVFHVMSKSLKNKVSASNFKTITIKVNTGTSSTKKSQTITASNKTIVVGQTVNLNAKSSSGLKLVYDTDNQNVTIDSSGNIIARKVGVTKITIKQAGNSTYNPVSKVITITVKAKTSSTIKKTQKIVASNKNINVGKTTTLNAKTSSGLKLTYKSSNPKIASVNVKGIVTGKKAGKTTITIKQAGNSKFKTATKKVTVVVNKNTQKIVAKGKIINVGKSISLGAKATSKLKLTYKSSNPKVASVNSKGIVTGKKAGNATITVAQKGNYKFKPTSKKIIIVVKDTGTYTIIYHGGYNTDASKITGKMSKQTVRKNQVIKLKKNKFKKKGYEFVGWSTVEGKANKNGSTSIDKFSNINMTHFQLGTVAKVRKPSAVGNGKTWKQLKNSQKQQLVDKVKVKNLAGNKKTIHLYAVWKGKGPEAAVDWGYIIAADNSFRYGGFDRSSSKWTSRDGNRNHRTGCYFCKTNRKEPHGDYSAGKSSKPYDINKSWYDQSKAQKYDRTWCCNPFVVACYTHGANEKKKCGGGSMNYGSWTGHKGNGKFKRASGKSLKTGDVFFSRGHVWMYAGKKNGRKVILESSGSDWKKSSIHWEYDSSPGSGSKGRVRYYPN